MCIVVISQENSKKSVKSDYFGVKLVSPLRFGKEGPKKSGNSTNLGYPTSFTGISTKFSTFSTAFPQKLGIAAYLLKQIIAHMVFIC